MTTLIQLEVFVMLLFLLEAKVEQLVISMKSSQSPNYSSNNKKEHAWSLVWAVGLCVGLTYITGTWLVLPSLLLSRRLFFDYSLKLFRKRPVKKIEGNGWFDARMRDVFGLWGGYKELISVLLLKALYLFLIIKFFIL